MSTTLSKLFDSVRSSVEDNLGISIMPSVLDLGVDGGGAGATVWRWMSDPYMWVSAGGAFLITYWLYSRYRERQQLPPGPTRWPLLGNLVEIMRQPDPSYVYFTKISPRYGPLMTVSVGPFPAVVINDMDGIRQTLTGKYQHEFGGRVLTMSGLMFTEGGKDIAIADIGPGWSLHRKLAMTAIKQFASKDTLTRLIHECTTEVCHIMTNMEEPFDPKSTIYLIVYNLLARLCFGKSFAFDDEDFQWLMKIIKESTEDFGSGLLGDYVPFLAFLPTPTKRRLEKVMVGIIDYMDKFIMEHVQTFDANNIRDITDAVINAQKEFEQEGTEDMSLFTEVHRRQTILDIFFAGTDTTAFTVYWLILTMVAYPRLQEEIHSEIDGAFGRDRVITYNDRVKLPRTLSIIYEVMRYRPIAPFSIPHKVTRTVQVNGYTIPKDMMVLPNIYNCHFDAKLWNEPEKFNPARFIDERGNVMQKKEGFVPFSAGRRQCAGENVAKAELFLTFTNLMQKLRFKPDPSRKEPYTLDIKVDGGPFLCAPCEYKVMAEMR